MSDPVTRLNAALAMTRGSVLIVVALHSLMAAGSASGQVLTLTGGVVRAGSSESSDTGLGLVIGGHFSVPVADRFSLQAGATYTQRFVDGFAFQGFSGVTQTITEIQTRIDYLEIPILLKVNFLADAPISPHVLLGPAVGIKVRCIVKTTTSFFDPFGASLSADETEASCPDNAAPRAVQIDGRVGLGVDVEVSSGLTAVADVSYSLGLTTIFPDSSGKSRALIVRVGVALPIG